MNDLISIIIPTYKERENILPLIERIHKAVSGYNYETVIVDDNSRDGTGELVAELSKKYPVRFIVRTNERGLASAVVHGIAKTIGDRVIVMDADLQHPPEVLPDMIKALDEEADVVVGSRYVEGGGCQGWGLVRRIISKGAIAIAHFLLPSTRKINDPMSGFFGFKRLVVADAKLKPTGYKILLEVLLEGQYEKAVEVPFIFVSRSAGESKLNAQQQVEYLKHVLSLMVRTGELAMLIKFVFVGLSGVGVNLGVYWLLTRYGGLADLDYIAVLIGIEVSIITNFILNDTFTFAKRRAGKSFLGRLGKFNLICLTGAGIQWGLFLLFTRIFGVFDVLSNAIGIVVAFLWNYFVNRNWTWR